MKYYCSSRYFMTVSHIICELLKFESCQAFLLGHPIYTQQVCCKPITLIAVTKMYALFIYFHVHSAKYITYKKYHKENKTFFLEDYASSSLLSRLATIESVNVKFSPSFDDPERFNASRSLLLMLSLQKGKKDEKISWNVLAREKIYIIVKEKRWLTYPIWDRHLLLGCSPGYTGLLFGRSPSELCTRHCCSWRGQDTWDSSHLGKHGTLVTKQKFFRKKGPGYIG